MTVRLSRRETGHHEDFGKCYEEINERLSCITGVTVIGVQILEERLTPFAHFSCQIHYTIVIRD